MTVCIFSIMWCNSHGDTVTADWGPEPTASSGAARYIYVVLCIWQPLKPAPYFWHILIIFIVSPDLFLCCGHAVYHDHILNTKTKLSLNPHGSQTTDSSFLPPKILRPKFRHELKVLWDQIQNPDVIPTINVMRYFIIKTVNSGFGRGCPGASFGHGNRNLAHISLCHVTIHWSRKDCS